MKKLLVVLAAVVLSSCNSEPTLQKYFVDNSENTDFVTLDISPSILGVEKESLTAEQQNALKSFEKINVLAFPKKEGNQVKYDMEVEKVRQILKDEKYQELMHAGSNKNRASISYIGTEEHIQEFIIFGNQEENGFAVVRVLGKDMTPNSIMEMLSVLQKSKIDTEQLKPLQALLPPKM